MKNNIGSRAANHAIELLCGDDGVFTQLRIHEFENDLAAHDDERIEELHQEFLADFKRVKSAISKEYGPPIEPEEEHDDKIPIGGVMEFAIWEIDGRLLFVAVAHEDRELPIELSIGMTTL